ncbi:MAG: polysaccharide deacetylase family protein [Kofleriaceae bacterium]
MSVRAAIKNVVFDRVPGLLRRGVATSRRVAITFDDGPDEMTGRYLDLLDDLGVPATFFVLGEHARNHPEAVREYVRRGHQVAGHGYDHQRFTKLTRAELIDQCRRTDEAIGGQPSGNSWVRPPHGSLDSMSLISLRAAGYVVALWSLDSCDYGDRDVGSLVERCSPPAATGGEVLLFHEGQEWTLEALPRIITAIHASGLECVTMFDLFAR